MEARGCRCTNRKGAVNPLDKYKYVEFTSTVGLELTPLFSDDILDLSSPDEQFDIAERPDYQQYIEHIMSHFNDEPKYISSKLV